MMWRLFPALALLSAVSVLSAALPSVTSAETRAPLVQDGKTTLYQRVLTRPGAKLVPDPGDSGGGAVPALSQFYVYERKPLGGTEWLEVGAGSRGQSQGWIAAPSTLPWKQQLTLAFTNPAGRERTLLFAEEDTVTDLLKSPDPATTVAPLRQAVVAGKTDPRVVSIEPETYIDIEKQFYLLPILEAEEIDTGTGFRARVLEVASVTKDDSQPPPVGAKPAPKPEKIALRSFSAAIVFVVDTTISMKPYLDRTREAVKKIYDEIENAKLGKQVKFGLVGYRSSIKNTPALEYVSKLFVDPNDVKDRDDFLAKVKDLKVATVSSSKFDEDPYAGLMTAARDINWDNFGGRYVVLITDAGAIRGDDPLSTTELSAKEVRLELERLGIAVSALHLETPQGKRNHRRAKNQYDELTDNPVVDKPLYYPVDAGSVTSFGEGIDTFVQAVVSQVKDAAAGKPVPGSAGTVDREKQRAGPSTQTAKPSLPQTIEKDLQLIGRAMQLAYLGRVQGTKAPPLFEAWLSDRDFENPDKATTEVRVLLTRNQLSDLAQVVRTILQSGEDSQQTSTADFFDLIRSAAAHLARDPAALNDPDATRLGDLGLLGEYLDDLPYKSEVMSLDRDVWASYGITQQEEFLDGLRRKLRHYQVYEDDTDRWVTLAPGADPGDGVYPVPLSAMP